jgi:hypothetical protein
MQDVGERANEWMLALALLLPTMGVLLVLSAIR